MEEKIIQTGIIYLSNTYNFFRYSNFNVTAVHFHAHTNMNFAPVYNGEYEVVIYCPMTFETYPLDSHICDFKLGSFSYDSSIINFTMGSLIFNVSKQVSLLDYSLQVIRLPDDKRKYGEHGSIFWVLVGFEIKLERYIKKYVINYYLPSGLLATVSWVSSLYLNN